MDHKPLNKGKSPYWVQMSDEQYEALTDNALAGAVSFIEDNFLPQIPALSERLKNAQVLRLARTALQDAIMAQAQASFSDPYADDREMAQEAKATLAALRRMAKLLDKIPERSAQRYLRSSGYQMGVFSSHFHSSLDDAIERFKHWSISKRGRPSNVGHILSAKCVAKALEIFLDRKFKRDVSMAEGIKKSATDRSDQRLVSLDARFVEHVLKLIDPSTTRSNVKSALQGSFQMENRLKNRDQNTPN